MTLPFLRRLRGVLIAAPAIHPFLLGAWFVLDVSRRGGRPDVGAAIAFLVVLGIGSAGAKIVLTKAFSDPVRGGIATTVVLVPILCFQETRQFLATLRPTLAEFGVVVPLFLLFVAASFVLLRRMKGDLSILHGAMNASSIIFVLWSLLPFFKEAYATSVPPEPNPVLTDVRSTNLLHGDPDIYYILLDAYTAQKSLSRYWNFDNAGFLSELRKRGFYIAGDSRSQYTTTAQSMASTLNMDTLQQGEEPFLAIRNNRVVHYLRSRHYTIENLSPFDVDGSPAFYSYFTDAKGSGEGFMFYFFHTGPGILFASLRVEGMPGENLRILSKLVAAGEDTPSSPKFVYAHLMTPHGPFGFDRDGAVLPLFSRGGWNSLRAYLNQLIGTNTLLLPVVDTILAHSSRDPIIIIQGDHGSRIVPGRGMRDESHTILNAYHLPAGGTRLLTSAISPVNSFRVIFRYYFREEIPLADIGADPSP